MWTGRREGWDNNVDWQQHLLTHLTCKNQMLLTLNVQTTDGKIALFSPFLPWNCQTLHRRERIKQAPALSFFSFSIFFWSAHVKFLRRKYVVCGLTRPQFDWRVKYVTVAAAYPVSDVTTSDNDAQCFTSLMSCLVFYLIRKYSRVPNKHAARLFIS